MPCEFLAIKPDEEGFSQVYYDLHTCWERRYKFLMRVDKFISQERNLRGIVILSICLAHILFDALIEQPEKSRDHLPLLFIQVPTIVQK